MRHLVQLLVLAILAGQFGCGGGDPESQGGPLSMRRLTPDQYTNAITDLFGAAVDVSGRFEPDSRHAGLNAIGTSRVAVTPSGFEQYEAMARSIAAQVTSPELREQLLPCSPTSVDGPDDGCTERIVRKFGPRLLRRPLNDDEVLERVEAARAAARTHADFHTGVELVLTSLLVAPDFLFRIETAEAAPLAGRPDRLRLTDVSLASRLSYFLWNRGPDEALLKAATRGALSNRDGLEGAVDRLLTSEHLADGVRAFFDDLFTFDQFDDLGKDVTRYPLYSNRLAADAREQTLRFVVDHVVARRADYRELFTSKQFPMTRSLGPLYGVPVYAADGWEDLELPADHPRAGLLAHASFAMLFAHPGRSSPTLRGVFLREALLCQAIPEAPADVDFSNFAEDQDAVHKTARDRLAVHASEPSCRGCHTLTDPIGLGLEAFDGIGKYRTSENGAPIDASGDLDGNEFANAAELGRAFAASPLIGPCLVRNLYRYAVGREETSRERRLLSHLQVRFADLGYDVAGLMREIALSEAFRTATALPVAGQGAR